MASDEGSGVGASDATAPGARQVAGPDEPTGELDTDTSDEILSTLARAAGQLGVTVVAVTTIR